MTGRITDISRSLQGDVRVTLTLNSPDMALLEDLAHHDKLTIDLKRFYNKRSRNANNYAWVLIGKLAAKLETSPDEVYRECITDIGDNYEIVCTQAKTVDSLRALWEKNGVGWVTDTFGSLIPSCVCVRLFYGSSCYDTAQMSRLIKRIVEECKEQGIETATPDELAKMMEEWDEVNHSVKA